jgi:hypothetical protein
MFLSSRAAYDPREVVWVVVAACVGAAVGTGVGAAVATGVAATIVVVALELLLAGAGVGAAVIAVAGRSVKTSAVVCDVPLTEATTAVD